MSAHMHPSESIVSSKDTVLEGKRILLAITGSIAAVECFDLARELIRHGALVRVVMSREAQKVVTPCAMEFATGSPAILDIGGQVEHVTLCGEHHGKFDLLLISPCTSNTISKLANGIDDTPVTTVGVTAIGSGMPVLIAPAMHASMYTNIAVQKNVRALERMGVEFIGPHFKERKAKIAAVDEIVARVIRRLGKRDYVGRRVLVIGGSSEEPIDEMRVISNRGTGETALSLAREAYLRGAEVDLWMGKHSVEIPSFIRTREFKQVRELVEMADEVRHDLVLVPAALSDYAPEKFQGKIPSGKDKVIMELRPLPKLLAKLRERECTLVAFKAEYGVDERELVRRARDRLESNRLDAIIANDLSRVGRGTTEVIILAKDGMLGRASGSKAMVAGRVLDEILKVMK